MCHVLLSVWSVYFWILLSVYVRYFSSKHAMPCHAMPCHVVHSNQEAPPSIKIRPGWSFLIIVIILWILFTRHFYYWGIWCITIIIIIIIIVTITVTTKLSKLSKRQYNTTRLFVLFQKHNNNNHLELTDQSTSSNVQFFSLCDISPSAHGPF